MSGIQDLTQVRRSIKINGRPEDIFAALTDEQALRTWFAEHAEIEPRAGGAYRFWGSTTFAGSDPSGATQSILVLEPPRRLAICWPLKGIETVLMIDIGDGDVTATHDLPGNTERHLYWLTLDGIEIILYNLKAFVETGAPLCLPDYRHSEGRMRLDVSIHATPGDVFEALTDPAVMDTWVSTAAEVDLRPDGIYSYGWTDDLAGTEQPAGPMKVVEVDPGRLLVHDWEWPGESPTQVSWEVTNKSGSTIVTLTHSGFGVKDDVDGYVQGWTSFLCKLKSKLEGLDQPAKPELAGTSS